MYYHSYAESGKTNHMSTSVDYFGSIYPLPLNYNLNSPYNINELHRRQVRRKSTQNIGMWLINNLTALKFVCII